MILLFKTTLLAFLCSMSEKKLDIHKPPYRTADHLLLSNNIGRFISMDLQ